MNGEIEKFIEEKYGYDATHGVAQNIETARYLIGRMKFYSVMNTDTLENDTIQFNLDEEVVQRPVAEKQFKTDKKEFSIKTDGYQNLNGEITPRFILNVTSPIIARGVFWSTSIREEQGMEGIRFSEYSDFAKILKAKPGQDVTFILPKEALQFIREKSKEQIGTRLPGMQIYNFKTAFRRYIEKKIVPKGMNVYDFLGANTTLDKEWVKERNKEFTHTAILKYNYNESLKEKIRAVIREIIQDMEKLLAEQQEKEVQVKKAKEGKKELDFEYHDSWETGLQFLVIRAGVDKETFSKLQKEAGLNYHQYDAEMEERFTGWATTNIEKAWQILRDAGYYRPERA